MRRSNGLVILCILAFLIGLGFFAASTTPRVANTTFNLPPGATYCTHYPFDTASGGTVSVAFTASPGIVEQYVMTETQYNTYYGGNGLTYLGTDSGSSGSFTASLPSGGTYQVLSCHGAGYESMTQSGSHTMTINALNPGPFYAGIGGVAIGVLFLGLALRMRKREAQLPSVPYMPLGGPAFGPYGTQAPPLQIPGAAGPLAPGPTTFGTVLVSLENRTSSEETVQLLLNGAPTVTIRVPAGGTSQATLHPGLPAPSGSLVRVEVVTPDGRRGSQDVLVAADKPASVTLRIG